MKDLSREEFYSFFKLTRKIKKGEVEYKGLLKRKTLVLLFEKPSLRTRVSFEVAIRELGGWPLYISNQEVQLGRREAIRDVARTISCYAQGVILRTFSHQTFLEFAENSDIPVINGLTDLLHPVQALSDFYTISEKVGLKDVVLAFIGDGNNVCNSLILGSAILGLTLKIATPPGYEPKREILNQAIKLAKKSKARIFIYNNPQEASRGANILYTDVWASMGQEKESAKRRKVFKDFRIDDKILSLARKDCLVMHCLPAHRGEEITSKVLESKHSIVFQQAENRIYAQKALLVFLFKKGRIG